MKKITRESSMSKSQPTVIIADDVDIMRELLERYLINLNCNVIAMSGDGIECMSQIKSLSPDMAFLDINMPGKTGFEILDEIKQLDFNIFSVVVSAHGSFDNLKTAIDKGAQGFIVKPYKANKIKEIVDKYFSCDPNESLN